jgi:predicted  nucleic acid-binding Zn-ribbon protein
VPVRADPFAQLKLLDVQDLDSRLDALRHQVGSLPETAALADVEQRRASVADAIRDLRVMVDDLTAEQRKADRDVEAVRTRRERDQAMVDSGSAGAKELERLLHELESLQRRIGDLEDAELEVMERLEAAQAQLGEREEQLAALEREHGELQETRAAKAADLEGQLAETTAERTTTAAGVPDDLLALYQRLREQKGGVGAAALRARQCGGCRLTLDNSILGEIARRPTDDVVRCEECGRILVRTGESGL